jgi:asparagine synthase (glutamine-hydrolysing)
MRIFVCLLDPGDRGIRDTVLRSYESLPRARGLAFEWKAFDHVAVLTAWDDAYGDPLVACEGLYVAIGVARLDNRSELERWAGAVGNGLTDLQLTLRAIVRLGGECIPRLLGDFAFVVWESTTRTAVAACDALAVRKLYATERDGLVAFANRAEALSLSDRYDMQFLAEQVASSEATADLTVYEGVRAIPAGTVARLARERLTSHQYWSPLQVDPEGAYKMSDNDAAEAIRHLLVEAVRSRLSSDGKTWAQLSGGLDSSAIVSTTQWLAATGALPHSLAGTVTYVDREATAADEREYSDLIVQRWQVRNETIFEAPMWCDERRPPPRIDQPRVNFMFHPRESRLCEIVRGAGGHVLLTGQGPDEYLRGSMYFFADWLARGQVRSALQEMLRRAAIGRVSFWELAYRNALVPLLPTLLRQWLGPEVTRLPAWVNPIVVRRYNLRERQFELALCAGRLGHKYSHSMSRTMVVVGKLVGHLVLDDELDVRHPFLDRRLVEFGLGLPPTLTTRPYASKWVLREAMRGIVPDGVRTRVGKGSQIERHAWSLSAQRTLLEPLVREPILADLGVIDGATLRSAFEGAQNLARSYGDPQAALQQVLSIEAWLQIRAGRWPRGLNQSFPDSSLRYSTPHFEGHSGRNV